MKRWKFALLPTVTAIALTIAVLVGFPSVRASADTWAQGFVRDATGNLDVNVASGAGVSTSSPTFARVQDGIGTSTATVSGPQLDANSNSANALTVAAYHYIYNGSSWDRARSCAGVGVLCVAGNFGVSSDGQGATGNGIPSVAYNFGYNGTGFDRLRVDANTSGTLRVANGGAKTAAVAVGAGTVVVSANPGRLVSILITTAGTVATTCYDNASAASGTVIGITPATTTVGTVYTFNMPATSGITCSNPASSAAFTTAYN